MYCQCGPIVCLPLGLFAHPGDDPVKGLFSTLLESLGDRFSSLFVGSEVQQSNDQMFQSHLSMGRRAVLKNWE